MGFRDLNQYQQANAKEKVRGYITVRRYGMTAEQEFDAAKAECLKNLKEQVAQIESMEFSDFYPKAKAAA